MGGGQQQCPHLLKNVSQLSMEIVAMQQNSVQGDEVKVKGEKYGSDMPERSGLNPGSWKGTSKPLEFPKF